MTQLLFTEASCDCDPPILASTSVVIAGFGTLLWWVMGIRPQWSRMSVLARVLGFAGLSGAVVFGLTRAISDAVEVIT